MVPSSSVVMSPRRVHPRAAQMSRSAASVSLVGASVTVHWSAVNQSRRHGLVVVVGGGSGDPFGRPDLGLDQHPLLPAVVADEEPVVHAPEVCFLSNAMCGSDSTCGAVGAAGATRPRPVGLVTVRGLVVRRS